MPANILIYPDILNPMDLQKAYFSWIGLPFRVVLIPKDLMHMVQFMPWKLTPIDENEDSMILARAEYIYFNN